MKTTMIRPRWTGVAVLLLAAGAMRGESVGADGKSVFLAAKCNKCHEIKSLGVTSLPQDDLDEEEKSPVTDLSAAGKGRDADWLRQWLNRKIDKESLHKPGKKVTHKKKWNGSEDDLQALVTWLLTLKK